MLTKKIKFNGRTIEFNIRDDADESVAAEVYKHREYRAADDVIKNATGPIVDVGAHAGFFTLYAKALNPGATIYALEPENINVALLHQHLKANGAEANTTVVASALAGTSGQRELELSKFSHNHRLASVAVYEMASRLEPDLNRPKKLLVSAMTFSDFCQQYHLEDISLLKMDIEGAEYEVFDSFSPADFARVKAIIMEYHDLPARKHSEIEELLRVNGFSVQEFPSKFDKAMGFIFAMNKRS